MKYEDFVGQVQRRARIDSARDAERAIRATLEALSDALLDGDSEALARQLPDELAECLRHGSPPSREPTTHSTHLLGAKEGDPAPGLPEPEAVEAGPTPLQEPEGLPRLLREVADREGTNPTQARAHVKAVFEVLTRAVEPERLDDLREHLPPDIARLFEEGGPNLPRA